MERKYQGRADQKGHYRLNPSLSREFSKIAKDKVEVKYDDILRIYVLFYRGSQIMYLSRSISWRDKKEVREHFEKKRSGFYHGIKKKLHEMDEKQEREEEKYMDDFAQDVTDDVFDYVCKGKKHIVL